MISLATADNPKFDLSNYELKKHGINYTLETVRYFRTELGNNVSLYWLTGADSLAELKHWYGIIDLIDEYNLAVMYRAGCDKPEFTKFKDIWGLDRIKKLQNNIIKTPLIDISSTKIRDRLSKNMDVTGLLHPAVINYIAKHNLYKDS